MVAAFPLGLTRRVPPAIRLRFARSHDPGQAGDVLDRWRRAPRRQPAVEAARPLAANDTVLDSSA